MLLGIAFIAWGDRVFPGRTGEVSHQVRTTIVNALKGSFPTDAPGENPSERTKKAIEELERQ